MIRVAIIGAGHWGPNLIRNFHNGQTSEVRWVVDTNDARLDMVKSRFQDVNTTADAKDALDDAEVDAVVIATPTVTHFELAQSALNAGKHVLVEKPITEKPAEGEALVALAEEKNLVLIVGHVFLYNNAIRRVKEYLDAGDVGDIHYISMERTNLGPIRMDVNAAYDLAAHDISIASWWLGKEPEAVSATGQAWINEGVEDAIFATLRYPGNVLVNLHASWLNPKKVRSITVVGADKMLTFDDMNMMEPIRIYNKTVTDQRVKPGFVDTFVGFRTSIRDGDIVIPRVSAGEPLKNECDHFIDCVKDGKKPVSDGQNGVDVVKVLAAIQRSIDEGGKEQKV
jgi:predicted dehydrogenase